MVHCFAVVVLCLARAVLDNVSCLATVCRYLWYSISKGEVFVPEKELADLLAIKTAFELSDDDVATAMAERGKRIEKKYGTPSMLVHSETLTTVGC